MCNRVPSTGKGHVIVKAWKKKVFRHLNGEMMAGLWPWRLDKPAIMSQHIGDTRQERNFSLAWCWDIYVICYNYFSVVPPGLANLINLEILNLFNNQIEELPTSLSSMPKLRILNVGWVFSEFLYWFVTYTISHEGISVSQVTYYSFCSYVCPPLEVVCDVIMNQITCWLLLSLLFILIIIIPLFPFTIVIISETCLMLLQSKWHKL
jgi:hypothetical protein